MKRVKRMLWLVLGLSVQAGWAEALEMKAEKPWQQVITERSDRIVETMAFQDAGLKLRVRDLIVEHYRMLDEAETSYLADVLNIRGGGGEDDSLQDLNAAIRKTQWERQVRDHHFAFIAELKVLVGDRGVDQVKDGLTYGVLQVTYHAYVEMIPALSEDEKQQIMIWLVEAREHAMDAGSSKEKHAWFKKYKGRINNYLSGRGYDLKKIEQERRARVREE